MKLLIKAAIIAAALGASAAASAATFDFSYTFSDGQEITGSLDGTLSGTTISNISDLQVSLNGIAFAGGTDSNGATSLAIYGYDSAAQNFDVPAVFSTVASQNNFIIADENPDGANSPNYYFTFVSAAALGGSESEVAAVNFLHSDSFSGPGDTQTAIDMPDDGTWTVTPAPVPVPAALPLLASGLAMFGIGRRRRAA